MPTTRQLAAALKLVADLLGVEHAEYCFEGRFRFELGGDWSLVLSPDSNDRFRLDVWIPSRRVASMWCTAEAHGRLGDLVLSAREESAALTI